MREASFIPAFQLATPLILFRCHSSLITRLQKFPQPSRRQNRTNINPITMVTSLPSPTTRSQSHAGTNPVFAQCMIRVNNPTASHTFYTNIGMKFFTRLDFPDFKFSLFFFGYSNAVSPPLSDPQPQRAKWLWARPEPTVELTWNWPADTFEQSLRLAEDGNKTEQYVNGNQQPMGFGYLDITVTDVGAAIAGLEAAGVPVAEEITTNGCASATVVDPDGYHIRINGPRGVDTAKSMAELDPVFDAVMLRVKDPRSAVAFFEHLGLRYLTRVDNPSETSTEYYLAYTNKTSTDVEAMRKMRECKMKLLHVWGTEEEREQKYANGNVKPYRGFGHVGVIVDDIYKIMDGLTNEGYKTVRKPGPFGDVGELAFVEEPSTSYWVEIIKREGEPANTPYEQPVLG